MEGYASGPNQAVTGTYSYVYDGRGRPTTTYTYDTNHNRATMVTSAGTTHYTYDAATGASGDVELQQKTDPDGTITTYSYDTAGNLTTAIHDPAGAKQKTTYVYDVAAQGCAKRLCEVDRPDGATIRFSYDADGNRLSKTVTTSGPVPTTTVIHDVYQAGRIAYQTDGAGNTLATFSYDAGGTPSSVQVGADPATAPRYYYVYNAHGDVVALADAAGTVVASYSYDVFGSLTSSNESFPGGWSNPYRYDGTDRVRYDAETGLYWMSVRAYDPTLGRFLARDPLNRQAEASTNQPYVYGANNPLANVDPSGQFIWQSGMTASQQDYAAALIASRMNPQLGKPAVPPVNCREDFSDSKCTSGQNWVSWMEDATGARFSSEALVWGAGFLAFVGSFLLRFYAAKNKLSGNGPLVSKFESVVGLLDDAATLVVFPLATFLGAWAGLPGRHAGPAWLGYLGTILSEVSAVLLGAKAAVLAVQALLQTPFARFVANAAAGLVALIVQAIGGTTTIVEDTAKLVAGDAVGNLVQAGSTALAGIGNFFTGIWSGALAEPIWDWCAQNAGQCGPEPQHIFP